MATKLLVLSPWALRSKALAIAGGDVAALLAFAAVGRASHGWDVVDFETLATAGPFIAGEPARNACLSCVRCDGRAA